MFKSIFNMFIFLPFFLVGLISIDLETKCIESGIKNNSIQEKSDNPNNHEMIQYDTGDTILTNGNYVSAYVSENPSGQNIFIDNFELFFKLKDDYTPDEFSETVDKIYVTLYDFTTGTREKLEVAELYIVEDFYIGINTFMGTNWVTIAHNRDYSFDLFSTELQEFHDYSIGINLKENDDTSAYFDNLSLESPELTKFDAYPYEELIVFKYEFLEPENPYLTFDYNDIYIKINNQKYSFTESHDQLIIDGLKPATEYYVNIGYEATKTIQDYKSYDISTEYKFKVETLYPDNYSSEVITFILLLLLLLIIILLILIAVILYWNYQRRKVNGMALVVGEDTQAYEPVYEYNYYQENEVDIPNTSSNQGNEVYGYFDEVQDNQEEPYGYFDEVQDSEHYQDEVYGYFDEVYDDTESGIHDYENPHEDFDDMEEW